MVVLFDLEDVDGPTVKPLHHPSLSWVEAETGQRVREAKTLGDARDAKETDLVGNARGADEAEERANPNVNGFSAALSCYPIVRQLASQLDLNTLHALSRTCRQFRANLLEYRSQLVKHTLHCSNEGPATGPTSAHQLTSGRVGICARDMVGECQRCATVVCRNCTMKPPPTPTLRARHRRLCRTCSKAPLVLHLASGKHRGPLSASAASSASSSPDSQPFLLNHMDQPRAFTAPAFERTPCNCDNVVWLCSPCGKDLKNADTMYVRGWSWRTRYSHYLGGVGTGAGEGNEGVECGRGNTCLGARIVEHETCQQDILDALEKENIAHPESPERWRGTSYLAQEIEGIGGVLKVKHKKQVRVGECVKLYEDEREKSIQYLEREVTGKLRSWCSWCDRVVLGEKDEVTSDGLTRVPSTSSFSSSTSQGPHMMPNPMPAR
ncbi:hypothetical protein LEMA_P000550.1 [Plenodomus lingam JN3]|uniref:F-box domain-containing protein n=1 Tax=Leptosphaeria maculans (strain JN3 / isolate v23.1.3 / race Av1-4-5-6-7-8) TaxID=985895 RepID=E5ADH9_LEPMJ|nr:hypothetical protein LEMA_P000550.1 [Plenodomus lingam JN3]CBY01268.1 hypothetical protein LEMA_P000550.1 [Plenodomus lingam JN3]